MTGRVDRDAEVCIRCASEPGHSNRKGYRSYQDNKKYRIIAESLCELRGVFCTRNPSAYRLIPRHVVFVPLVFTLSCMLE